MEQWSDKVGSQLCDNPGWRFLFFLFCCCVWTTLYSWFYHIIFPCSDTYAPTGPGSGFWDKKKF